MDGVSVVQDEKVLEICFTTMYVWLILLSCTLKHGYHVNFMLCIFFLP